MKLKTFDLVLIALAAAIMCITAPISIVLPLTPIPITLGFFPVVLIGIILDDYKGALCMVVYLLIGAVGLPVFSNFTGGLPKLVGPTGGYLIGYIFQVAVVGFFVRKSHGKPYLCMIGALLGAAICYLCGTMWMSFQLKIGFIEGLGMGVLPFLPFDIVKIALAVIIGLPVRNTLLRQNILQHG